MLNVFNLSCCRFLSPVGAFILEATSLEVGYKRLFQQFCLWCGRMRDYSAPRDELQQLKQQGWQLLAEMQAKLPVFWSQLGQHLLGHEPEFVERAGPFHVRSM